MSVLKGIRVLDLSYEKGEYRTKLLEEIDQVLDEYYALRGWNYRGIPKKGTLTRLGLQELIEDLPKH